MYIHFFMYIYIYICTRGIHAYGCTQRYVYVHTCIHKLLHTVGVYIYTYMYVTILVIGINLNRYIYIYICVCVYIRAF